MQWYNSTTHEDLNQLMLNPNQFSVINQKKKKNDWWRKNKWMNAPFISADFLPWLHNAYYSLSKRTYEKKKAKGMVIRNQNKEKGSIGSVNRIRLQKHFNLLMCVSVLPIAMHTSAWGNEIKGQCFCGVNLLLLVAVSGSQPAYPNE